MKINNARLDFKAKQLDLWIEEVRSDADFEAIYTILRAAQAALDIVYPKTPPAKEE